MSYTTPAIGTVFPAQPNTSVVNPGPVQDASGHGLDEWLQAQAQATADSKNQVLIQDWTNGVFANWLTNYQAGRVFGPTNVRGDPDAIPPQPWPAFVCVVIAAPAGGVAFDVQPSGQPEAKDEDGNLIPGTGPYVPVCPVPAYDKMPAPATPQPMPGRMRR